MWILVGIISLILRADKMPREELVKVIPSEKLVRFCRSYLNRDPIREQLGVDQDEQYLLIKRVEASGEIASIKKKENPKYRKSSLLRTNEEREVMELTLIRWSK